MAGLKEQRFNIELYFELLKTESQTYEVLKKACRCDAMSRTPHPERHCYSPFTSGRKSVEDFRRSGRRSSSTDKYVLRESGDPRGQKVYNLRCWQHARRITGYI